MILRGHVQNGNIVLDEPHSLPDGTTVRIEVVPAGDPCANRSPRVGGMYKGQIQIADDFDELPDDLARAFGARHADPSENDSPLTDEGTKTAWLLEIRRRAEASDAGEPSIPLKDAWPRMAGKYA